MAVTVVDNNILTNTNNNVLDFQPYQTPTNYIPASSWIQIGEQFWSPYMTYTASDFGNFYTRELCDGTRYYYSKNDFLKVASAFPGWHVPTTSDFQYLLDYCGPSAAYRLKSTRYWGAAFGTGSDEFGFNYLPLGRYYDDHTPTAANLNRGLIWGSTVSSYYQTGYVCLDIGSDAKQNLILNYDNSYMPLRLVKD